VRVLDPHHGNVRRSSAPDEIVDVGDHLVAPERALDDSVLDVDHDQGGVRTVGQARHEGSFVGWRRGSGHQ
jgi:hypothetical protein